MQRITRRNRCTSYARSEMHAYDACLVWSKKRNSRIDKIGYHSFAKHLLRNRLKTNTNRRGRGVIKLINRMNKTRVGRHVGLGSLGKSARSIPN